MNVVAIRQKVKKAISNAPKTIQVYRNSKQDDGAGGYILLPEPILVTECDGVLNNSSSNGININVSTGGVVNTEKGITFITVYEDGVRFKKDDFFTIDGTKYVIKNAKNILEMNIYWELELEQDVED